jgi:hypothetical protein
MKKIFIIILILIIFINNIYSKDLLIILSGMTGNKKNLKHINAFINKNYINYEVNIVDFIDRKGIERSYVKLEKNLKEINYSKYDKINFFCYIYGGYMLFQFMEKNTIPNLNRIVLDRGPIEEKLAPTVRELKGNLLLAIYGGKNLIDFSYSKYYEVPINLKQVDIGIIIETKATLFCYLYKPFIKKKKPSFVPGEIIENYDDYYFINKNHKEMYKINSYFNEVDHFFKYGVFSKNVNRKIKDYLKYF